MSVLVNDPDFTLYVGDVLEQLREFPDESVHCVVTSPPYWGLRDYGTGSWDGGDPDCDHLGEPLRQRQTETPAGQSAHAFAGTMVVTLPLLIGAWVQSTEGARLHRNLLKTTEGRDW